MSDSYNTKRVNEILSADLQSMTKSEVHAMRNELVQILRWWAITPMRDLRFFGLIGMFQKMLDRRDEMLQFLKA